MSSSDAYTVLEAVYWHRLTGPDDTIQNLTARDPEVNQAYSTLLASAELTTGGTDATAVLHHLSLLRNQGTTGGFIAEGDQVTSVGIRRLPPECLVNAGGFINGLPTNPFPCGTEPALVFLTVHGRNGQVFRYFTNAYTCGGRGTYGFHGVMSGSADLIVRPFRGCCQQGETTFQITCPPNPTLLLPCVPVQTNLLVSVTMGPPQPPGFFGQVVNRPRRALTSGSPLATTPAWRPPVPRPTPTAGSPCRAACPPATFTSMPRAPTRSAGPT